MPISYGQIDTILSEKLDDERSQRYLVANRLGGINSAISRMQSAVTYKLANRKGSEEIIRDMSKIGVWQTDTAGSFIIDDTALGKNVSNIVAIYPEAGLVQDRPVTPASDGRFLVTAVWNGVGKAAKRVTAEEVPIIRDNALKEGNEVLAASPTRRKWAYYLNDGRAWLLPRSIAGRTFVAMVHIERFVPMTGITSTVDLPEYMTELLASWALEYISWKQGAGPDTLKTLASKDAAMMFAFNTD